MTEKEFSAKVEIEVRDYINERVAEFDKRVNLQFAGIESAKSVALDAIDHRMTNLNDLHKEMKGKDSTYARIVDTERMDESIKSLELSRATAEGKSSSALLISIGALLFTGVSTAISVYLAFTR